MSDAKEDQARQQGWVPEEEWKGEPDAWVPADEFVRRGSLFNHIKHLNKQNNELRQAIQGLNEHNARLEQQRLKEKESELRSARRAAMEESDWDTVEKLDETWDQVKQANKELEDRIEEVKQAPQEPVPNAMAAIKQFAEDNPWYKSDAARHAAFNAVCDSLIEKHTDGFDLVEEALTIFEEKFTTEGVKRKPTSAVDPGVEDVPRTRRSTSGSKHSIKSLSQEEQSVARRMVRSGAFQDAKNSLTEAQQLQKYVDQLASTGYFNNDRA